MAVWAIGDLHLSFGVPNKKMDIFGKEWEKHEDNIAKKWQALISPNDLVLIPGDISWAMRPEEVKPDLEWIDALPGTKLLIRGNHDYWWGSMKKVKELLPPSLHAIHNSAFYWKEIAIGGARLWDSPEYSFGSFCDMPGEKVKIDEEAKQQSEKVFFKELGRLEQSLKQMQPEAKVRIAMTHYPPIGADLQPSRASLLLEKHDIDLCVFGHLHGLKEGQWPRFGQREKTRYLLTSCDALNFTPIKLCDDEGALLSPR